jgi:hypothetical protein
MSADNKVDGEKAVALAYVAYEQGERAERARHAAPIFWEFKGHALKDTYFELKLVGRPNAKALRNVIRQMELYHEFVAEDEAAEAAPAQASESLSHTSEATVALSEEPKARSTGNTTDLPPNSKGIL